MKVRHFIDSPFKITTRNSMQLVKVKLVVAFDAVALCLFIIISESTAKKNTLIR